MYSNGRYDFVLVFVVSTLENTFSMCTITKDLMKGCFAGREL